MSWSCSSNKSETSIWGWSRRKSCWPTKTKSPWNSVRSKSRKKCSKSKLWSWSTSKPNWEARKTLISSRSSTQKSEVSLSPLPGSLKLSTPEGKVSKQANWPNVSRNSTTQRISNMISSKTQALSFHRKTTLISPKPSSNSSTELWKNLMKTLVLFTKWSKASTPGSKSAVKFHKTHRATCNWIQVPCK